RGEDRPGGEVVEHLVEERHLGGDDHRDGHSDEHRHPAHARGGQHVHVALTYGGDGAEPTGERPHRRGGEVGRRGGDRHQQQVELHSALASPSVPCSSRGAAIFGTIARRSSIPMAPARRITGTSPVQSMIVEGTWPGVGPASRYTRIESPSCSAASAHSSAGARPERFAEETASGPVCFRSASAQGWSGTRNATVP